MKQKRFDLHNQTKVISQKPFSKHEATMPKMNSSYLSKHLVAHRMHSLNVAIFFSTNEHPGRCSHMIVPDFRMICTIPNYNISLRMKNA